MIQISRKSAIIHGLFLFVDPLCVLCAVAPLRGEFPGYFNHEPHKPHEHKEKGHGFPRIKRIDTEPVVYHLYYAGFRENNNHGVSLSYEVN